MRLFEPISKDYEQFSKFKVLCEIAGNRAILGLYTNISNFFNKLHSYFLDARVSKAFWVNHTKWPIFHMKVPIHPKHTLNEHLRAAFDIGTVIQMMAQLLLILGEMQT